MPRVLIDEAKSNDWAELHRVEWRYYGTGRKPWEETMNVPELSSQSLRDLHSLIREALSADDASPATEKAYGVRRYPDWRKQAQAYETEMTKRGIAFDPIDWS